MEALVDDKLKNPFTTGDEKNRPPTIRCEVSLYTIKKDEQGTEAFGEKLLMFSETKILHDDNERKEFNPWKLSNYAGWARYTLLAAEGLSTVSDVMEAKEAWKSIIKDCAYRITGTLEDIFPELNK